MPAVLRWVMFGLVSLVLVYLSRASLRQPRSHGFYRWFAWEAISALVLVNGMYWLVRPLSWFQLVSWPLLVVSIVYLVVGLRALRMMGRPQRERADDTLYHFEKTTTLVTDGVYRYVRHPMYASLLFLAWGAFFKQISTVAGALAVASTLFLFLTARMEERENETYFGPGYRDYIQRSRMFVPFLF